MARYAHKTENAAIPFVSDDFKNGSLSPKFMYVSIFTKVKRRREPVNCSPQPNSCIDFCAGIIEAGESCYYVGILLLEVAAFKLALAAEFCAIDY